MREYEQIFLVLYCKNCSKTIDRFQREQISDRKFVSHVNEPNRFVCSTCGRFYNISNKKIKHIQLNKTEVTKNDNL